MWFLIFLVLIKVNSLFWSKNTQQGKGFQLRYWTLNSTTVILCICISCSFSLYNFPLIILNFHASELLIRGLGRKTKNVKMMCKEWKFVKKRRISAGENFQWCGVLPIKTIIINSEQFLTVCMVLKLSVLMYAEL